MKTQHTPGPWTCQPIGDESECNILGPGRELVATVSDNDARLIAAAPDLLAACKRFLGRTHLFDAMTEVDKEVIRAAIAKAQEVRS